MYGFIFSFLYNVIINIMLLLGKENKMKYSDLALLYVKLILDGRYSYNDAPKRLKPYIKKVAEDLGVWEEIAGGEQATPSNATQE